MTESSPLDTKEVFGEWVSTEFLARMLATVAACVLDVVSSYILVAPRVLGGSFQQINTRCDWKNDILSKSTDNGISLASSMDLLEDRSVVYNLGGKLVV